MAPIPDQLLNHLPAAARRLLEGNPKRELLKKINATLLVFDDQVSNLESGHSAVIPGDDGVSTEESLAAASASLLGGETKELSVLLLLPPAEFVAITQSMPGIATESVISALKLQAQSILPAYAEPVAMAVNPGSVESGDEHTALWISKSRMMRLFQAFANHGIFLAAVKPRLLNICYKMGGSLVIDYDRDTATAVSVSDGVIRKWLHINKLDLEQEEFAQQWQRSIASTDGPEPEEFASAVSYLERAENSSNQDYSFFPQGALSARKKVEKGQKLLLAAAAVALTFLIASIPFIGQAFEYRKWAATLEANREMSFDARNDQASVVNFENEWGPINDFPEQQVRAALYTLQTVLSPNQLTSLELSEGLIKIQGTSSEPQALLQRLEQDPMFTEVIFSRATNNTRYYIDLRISTVNFEGYMVRYFPDD